MAAIQLNLPTLATISSNKKNGFVTLLLNNNEILALGDSRGTSSSFIDKSLVHQLSIKVIPAKGEISLANASLTTKIEGKLILLLITVYMKTLKYYLWIIYVLILY